MRTPEEFKQQAELKNIRQWNVHQCSICGYQCAFILEPDRVTYDSGCHCVTYSPHISPRNFKDLADFYNMQTHPDTIRAMDKFWGFNDPIPA